MSCSRVGVHPAGIFKGPRVDLQAMNLGNILQEEIQAAAGARGFHQDLKVFHVYREAILEDRETVIFLMKVFFGEPQVGWQQLEAILEYRVRASRTHLLRDF